jgi:hypothetical protein
MSRQMDSSQPTLLSGLTSDAFACVARIFSLRVASHLKERLARMSLAPSMTTVQVHAEHFLRRPLMELGACVVRTLGAFMGCLR